MKICFHTNFEVSPNYIGGTERFLIKISKELKCYGYEPFIICSSLTPKTSVEGITVLGRIPEYIRTSFETYKYFSSTFIKNEIIGNTYSVDSLKRLAKYTAEQLSGIDADIFHLNSFASACFLPPGSNYFVTNHENELEYDGYWGNGFFDMMCDQVSRRESQLQKYKGLITPSMYYANVYSGRFNLPVSGINLGIHLEDFNIEAIESELKEQYFDDSKGTIILFPSRFQTRQKGHDIALKACSILKSKKIRFKLLFTGVKKSSEKYLPDFYQMVREYDLEDRIQITTFSDIKKAYRNSDIVISPEKYCSFGLSISESLALGIPTILSDIPTYKEIASDFKHAIFFNSGSPIELAQKLEELIAIGPKRNVSEAINFRIKFDLRNCAKRYADLYNK